jgi:3-isopropylmalate/(R)-2-methylmalate dehydratase small subunit
LPLKVTQEDLDNILGLVFENPSLEITVDLMNQKLIIEEKKFERFFEINSFKKNNLMNGLDDIDYLTNMKDEIINFSKKIPF